jgi:hypothetical protein
MKTNKLNISAKLSVPKMIVTITTFILLGSGYCFSQSNKTGQTMNNNKNIYIKKVDPFYIDKNDPVFLTIKGRAITDLKKSADPESPENILMAERIKTWSEEKQSQLETLFVTTINDYTDKTNFEPGTFMMVFNVLGKMDQKELAEEYDFRVLNIGDYQYVAEFWEDGIAVNSEAHALAYAHELANSEYARKHPDSDVGNVEVIKKNYADVRKSINDGKKERYNKVMAFLYTKEKDGSIAFHDPFQPLIDFK